MCSLPLHTAEQIGEVVRSHNMRGQPGDEEGHRQHGAKLNVRTAWATVGCGSSRKVLKLCYFLKLICLTLFW